MARPTPAALAFRHFSPLVLASLLLLAASLPSGLATWTCPMGTAPSAVTVQAGSWTSVVSYFTGSVTADSAVSLSDCLASAKADICVKAAPKGVLLYSASTLASNPATFTKSNCLYSTACNPSASNGNTTAQALAFTCKYNPPPPRPPPPPPGGCWPPAYLTNGECRCPSFAVCSRKDRCGAFKFVCSCLHVRNQEVRNKTTLSLLACRVHMGGQPAVVYV